MFILIFPDGETFNTIDGCTIAEVPDGLEIEEVEDPISSDAEKIVGRLEVDDTTKVIYLKDDEYRVPIFREISGVIGNSQRLELALLSLVNAEAYMEGDGKHFPYAEDGGTEDDDALAHRITEIAAELVNENERDDS
jgi:hypothetical protein